MDGADFEGLRRAKGRKKRLRRRILRGFFCFDFAKEEEGIAGGLITGGRGVVIHGAAKRPALLKTGRPWIAENGFIMGWQVLRRAPIFSGVRLSAFGVPEFAFAIPESAFLFQWIHF